MRIGYPCSNLSVGCSAARTFRLASYSPERVITAVQQNLDCLETVLHWNAAHDIRFFRISSSTVPFASHPVMTADWQEVFAEQLAQLGQFIRSEGMRVNMHPGQFTLLNSPREDVVANSIVELAYHADFLDLLGLDSTHKIQIHVGGVYGDKPAAQAAFIARYLDLPEHVKRRLVIENDERQYSLADCLSIHGEIGVPILFDRFHHTIFNHGESDTVALDRFIPTWEGHGLPMMDYSSQHPTKQVGAHTPSIDLDDFMGFLSSLNDRDLDIMLEIKDKETSALRAMEAISTRVHDQPTTTQATARLIQEGDAG